MPDDKHYGEALYDVFAQPPATAKAGPEVYRVDSGSVHEFCGPFLAVEHGPGALVGAHYALAEVGCAPSNSAAKPSGGVAEPDEEVRLPVSTTAVVSNTDTAVSSVNASAFASAVMGEGESDENAFGLSPLAVCRNIAQQTQEMTRRMAWNVAESVIGQTTQTRANTGRDHDALFGGPPWGVVLPPRGDISSETWWFALTWKDGWDFVEQFMPAGIRRDDTPVGGQLRSPYLVFMRRPTEPSDTVAAREIHSPEASLVFPVVVDAPERFPDVARWYWVAAVWTSSASALALGRESSGLPRMTGSVVITSSGTRPEDAARFSLRLMREGPVTAKAAPILSAETVIDVEATGRASSDATEAETETIGLVIRKRVLSAAVRTSRERDGTATSIDWKAEDFDTDKLIVVSMKSLFTAITPIHARALALPERATLNAGQHRYARISGKLRFDDYRDYLQDPPTGADVARMGWGRLPSSGPGVESKEQFAPEGELTEAPGDTGTDRHRRTPERARRRWTRSPFEQRAPSPDDGREAALVEPSPTGQPEPYKKGDVLFAAAPDVPAALTYIVESGDVVEYCGTYVMGVHRKGDFVGDYVALCGPDARHYTSAVAATAVTVRVVDNQRLRESVESKPSLARLSARRLSRKLAMFYGRQRGQVQDATVAQIPSAAPTTRSAIFTDYAWGSVLPGPYRFRARIRQYALEWPEGRRYAEQFLPVGLTITGEPLLMFAGLDHIGHAALTIPPSCVTSDEVSLVWPVSVAGSKLEDTYWVSAMWIDNGSAISMGREGGGFPKVPATSYIFPDREIVRVYLPKPGATNTNASAPEARTLFEIRHEPLPSEDGDDPPTGTQLTQNLIVHKRILRARSADESRAAHVGENWRVWDEADFNVDQLVLVPMAMTIRGDEGFIDGAQATLPNGMRLLDGGRHAYANEFVIQQPATVLRDYLNQAPPTGDDELRRMGWGTLDVPKP